MALTYVELDGTLREASAFGGSATTDKDGKIVRPGVWVSRNSFVKQMYNHVMHTHGDAVRVVFGCSLNEVHIPDEAGSGKVGALSDNALSLLLILPMYVSTYVRM